MFFQKLNFRNPLNAIKDYLLSVIAYKPHMADPTAFDPRGGTVDYPVEVTMGKKLYREMLPKTMIGTFSKRNDLVAGVTAFEAPSFDNTALIWKKDIKEGDEYRLQYNEASDGLPTYGDTPTESGEFPKYMGQDFRCNCVKSPGFQVTGKESRKLVKKSIENIPQNVQNNATDWMAREMERSAIVALLWGADGSLLSGAADGGKNINLGPGSGVGAGTPLMGMHHYTTDEGFMTYTPAALTSWNSTVNDAINGIDAAAADKITLAQLDKIREKLDDIHFSPVTVNGKVYKAVCWLDPQLAWRLKYILKDDFKYARERSANNPIFNTSYQIEYNEILFVAVPNLKKFRPAYNATTGYPDIGPDYSQTFKDYSNSETNAWALFLGAGALLMGQDGMLEPHRAKAPYGEVDGLAISVHHSFSFKRNQWDTKDGRTDSKCHSVLAASFYEPGQDW
jgi:hypothetical protein